MKSALWLPLFDELADPVAVARVAAEAEEAGWDGVFVWDHLRWQEPVREVADPWITMAAMAVATERVRLGPMVSPIARRRPTKLAKETATLDQLSGGRLTLGVGIGEDRFGKELSTTGEELDAKVRAQLLDESLKILAAAWSGDTVQHKGEHFIVDGIQFLPRPVQRPGVPVWAAGFPGKIRPIRRAARLDGYFPVNLERPEQLAEAVATIRGLRAEAGVAEDAPYDFAVDFEPGFDPAAWRAAGATWLVVGFPPESMRLDRVRGVLRDGPPTAG